MKCNRNFTKLATKMERLDCPLGLLEDFKLLSSKFNLVYRIQHDKALKIKRAKLVLAGSAEKITRG
jgi:hypothetical protein